MKSTVNNKWSVLCFCNTALLLASFLFSSALYAYQVEPMIKAIPPTGSGAIMRITITNTDAAPLALELSGLRVETNENGEVIREEEINDLLIFPMQTSIPAGRSQVVQVRYVGDQELDNGRVYAVKIDQLPVQIGSTKDSAASNQVNIGISFLTHILVQEAGFSPKLVVSNIKALDTGETEFDIQNIGNGTALLSQMKWEVHSRDGQRQMVNAQEIDTAGFKAQIPGAPKRTIKLKADSIGDITEVSQILASVE